MARKIYKPKTQVKYVLPERTLDTMSETIAMSSPSGRMSGRARAAASKRLGEALFGKGGLPYPSVVQPSEADNLRRHAKFLRELAAGGMKKRAYIKQAEMLEARANALQPEAKQKS